MPKVIHRDLKPENVLLDCAPLPPPFPFFPSLSHLQLPATLLSNVSTVPSSIPTAVLLESLVLARQQEILYSKCPFISVDGAAKIGIFHSAAADVEKLRLADSPESLCKHTFALPRRHVHLGSPCNINRLLEFRTFRTGSNTVDRRIFKLNNSAVKAYVWPL